MTKSSLIKKQEAILNTKNTPNYSKNTSVISFPPSDAKTDSNSNENSYSEIEIIDIPVVKRMVFQFNKPTELEFS